MGLPVVVPGTHSTGTTCVSTFLPGPALICSVAHGRSRFTLMWAEPQTPALAACWKPRAMMRTMVVRNVSGPAASLRTQSACRSGPSSTTCSVRHDRIDCDTPRLFLCIFLHAPRSRVCTALSRPSLCRRIRLPTRVTCCGHVRASSPLSPFLKRAESRIERKCAHGKKKSREKTEALQPRTVLVGGH